MTNFRFMTEQNTWLRKGRETSLRRSIYTYLLAFCISPSLYPVILCTPVLRFLCIHSSLDRISKIRGEICALKHRHLYLEKTNGSFCISKTPFKQQKKIAAVGVSLKRRHFGPLPADSRVLKLTSLWCIYTWITKANSLLPHVVKVFCNSSYATVLSLDKRSGKIHSSLLIA